MNFKLKQPKSNNESLILFYSTGEKIPLDLWDFNVQFPRKTKSQRDQELINMITM